ncbi:ETS homologous factor isoform X4 [Ovis aries]|uniref:ETS homologous factor isoform X4 n=1 Tax=Ovis aries TaxID=9940 RepID=UPI002952930E|nr:ETS homologous factor isoform X4 [Ovis aries]
MSESTQLALEIMILEGSGVMNLNPSNNLLHQQPAWTDSYSTCNVSSGFFGGQWHEIHPQYWTKYQVWEWLQHLLDTNQLDASCIPFQEFDINGEHLCSMSLQEFTRAAGTAGQLLYSNLQHLKWNGQCSSDLFQSTHNVIVKTEQTDPSIMNTWKEENYLYDTNYGSTVDLLDSKTFCRAQISMTTTGHLPIALLESFKDFPGCSDSKASAYSVRDLGSIPGSGRSPGEGNGNPLQYSCLENPMDRGAW